MKFLHSMIRVADINKSLDFYQKIMDLKLNRTMELEDCTLYFLKDEETGIEIELTHNNELPEGGYKHGDAFGHMAFATTNMGEFSQKLSEFGYEYFYEPFLITPKGPNIAFVKDPDGNMIELIERKA